MMKRIIIFLVGIFFFPSFSYSDPSELLQKQIIPKGYFYLAIPSPLFGQKISRNDLDGIQDTADYFATKYCQYHSFGSFVSYSIAAMNTDSFEFGKAYKITENNYGPFSRIPRVKMPPRLGEIVHEVAQKNGYSYTASTGDLFFPNLVFSDLICSMKVEVQPWENLEKPVSKRKTASKNIIPPHHEFLAFPSEDLAVSQWRRTYMRINYTIQDKAFELCQYFGFGQALSFQLKKNFSAELSQSKVYEIRGGLLTHAEDRPIWENYTKATMPVSQLCEEEMRVFGHLFKSKDPWYDPEYTHFPHLTITQLECGPS